MMSTITTAEKDRIVSLNLQSVLDRVHLSPQTKDKNEHSWRERAKEALEEAPTWAKTLFLFLMEQMSKVNEDITNVKEQLEMFKSEVDRRVTHLRRKSSLCNPGTTPHQAKWKA